MEKPSPILPTARVYCGVFREIAIKGNGRADHRFEANVVFKGTGLNYRPRRPDPKDENNWKTNLDKTPKFQCEWKELERIVQHRFEMLHILRMPHGAGKMCAPNIAAGNGQMHDTISFYAPYLVREARWLQDPAPARGVMRAFLENVKQSGQIPGRIDLTELKHSGFYHADWGGAFEALDAIHPDKATKRAVLMPMQRYVKWLANNRDPEGSGLTDIVNQSEIHQPLSRRFTVIDDKADRNEEESEQFRIKGVDASFFRYRLVKYLIEVADEMQEKAMANRFIAEAEVVQEVIRKKMWDENSGMFMDIDPKKRRKTGVKAACGFYPMASDIPTPAQQEKMLDTLGDRKEFWTKYPVPTLAITDPAYDPNGHWKGTRRETPWNGRVWTSVNGHIMDSLVYVAERGNKKAQRLCGDLMRKSIQMMSGELEGLEEASSFEHFSPETGRASHYRGVDRFLGAPVLDMVFRVACGFAVRFNDIQNDPVMADMPDFKLTGLPLGNKLYQVERKSKKFKLTSM